MGWQQKHVVRYTWSCWLYCTSACFLLAVIASSLVVLVSNLLKLYEKISRRVMWFCSIWINISRNCKWLQLCGASAFWHDGGKGSIKIACHYYGLGCFFVWLGFFGGEVFGVGFFEGGAWEFWGGAGSFFFLTSVSWNPQIPWIPSLIRAQFLRSCKVWFGVCQLWSITFAFD